MTDACKDTSADLIWLGAAELARRIANGRLSAVQVVEAHIDRIEKVNGKLNAVVVKCYDRARREADEADSRRNRGEQLGLLHGVPVTIKECFDVVGTPSTVGVKRFVNQFATQDSPLVRRLTYAGAIVVGKSNVSQLMLLHETDNPLYGRTNNPWDLTRAVGGSSGGEAAIISAGGSPLGLGSDLGGSIRQPAHSCGICGLLPTQGRLEVTGKRENFLGMEALSLQPGPMARHVEDLELGLRALMDTRGGSADSRIAPTTLSPAAEVDISRLRVGVVTDDHFFQASPALRRAVEEAANALAASGAQIERFDPPEMEKAVELYVGLISADGMSSLMRTLGDSPRDWRIRRLLLMGRLRQPLRSLAVKLLQGVGQRRLAKMINWTGGVSANTYWQRIGARSVYIGRFVDMLDSHRLDALIMPPHALPALRHGSTMHLPLAASYSFLPNLLGMPAGTVSITRVRSGEETDRPVNRDVVEHDAREVEIGSTGLPVAVQVIGRHWREDVVLATMRTLEAYFQSKSDYPARPPL